MSDWGEVLIIEEIKVIKISDKTWKTQKTCIQKSYRTSQNIPATYVGKSVSSFFSFGVIIFRYELEFGVSGPHHSQLRAASDWCRPQLPTSGQLLFVHGQLKPIIYQFLSNRS